MRILLTGASGFVGSSFINSVGSDYEVVCLGRTKRLIGIPNVTFIPTDLTSKTSVVDAADKVGDGVFDAIVHLAAHVPRMHHEDELQVSHDVNIQGTINLLEAFEGRFKRLIIGSTVEVYDQLKITSIINENSPLGPSSYYGATKLGSEFIACTFGKKQDVPVTVLRFSVIYGPNDPIERALPNFIKKALNNEAIEITGGEILRDYVHIDDVVLSINSALSFPSAEGILNIGTGSGISIEQAARDIVEASNSSSKIIINSGQSGVDIVVDPNKAREKIKFRAKHLFPDGIEEMIESFR